MIDAFFGPYLAERQWGTIREDYSPNGACWDYFPHEHARSRAYRWGEDGLLGFSDFRQRLCFAIALWNGRDPILKERLFGLHPEEATHGESVKELYWYLDAAPDASYLRARYRYPLRAFPYAALVAARERHVSAPGTRSGREFGIEDTGVFADGAFVDVTAEYAKAASRDVSIRITFENHANHAARLVAIPQLWFRNTWSWPAGHVERPRVTPVDADGSGAIGVRAVHPDSDLGEMRLLADPRLSPRRIVFTENQSNVRRLWPESGAPPSPSKDAFHEYVVSGNERALNATDEGTKCGFVFDVAIEAGGATALHLRLVEPARAAHAADAEIFDRRRGETRAYYDDLCPRASSPRDREIAARGFSTLVWSKKAYAYDVSLWLDGDPSQPRPPAKRLSGRNHDWRHFRADDVALVADSFEYPWFAAWDLAFEAVGIARADPEFARAQLELLLGPRYMREDGALPAYEFALMDANPPIHPWACLRVAAVLRERGHDSAGFLARAFEPLRRNFEWWKRTLRRPDGLYAGGFLGLDNVGAFDRGAPPRLAGPLAQADGTGWMAFFAASMARIAETLEKSHPGGYASRRDAFVREYFEVVRALDLLWHEGDGFYFDQIRPLPGAPSAPPESIRARSVAGLVPFFAVARLEAGDLRPCDEARARRIVARLLDEDEFLSPFGVRSASKAHGTERVVVTDLDGGRHVFQYAPAESETLHFGANSNWRGPVWVPVNILAIDALETWAAVLRDPDLARAAADVRARLLSLFRSAPGRPEEPLHFREFYCGDTGRGIGARHQGWSALAAELVCGVSVRL